MCYIFYLPRAYNAPLGGALVFLCNLYVLFGIVIKQKCIDYMEHGHMAIFPI